MKKREYIDSVHFTGRIWTVLALLVMFGVPVAVSIRYNAWPEFSVFLVAFIGVAPTYWTVTVIEAFTFTPMLGAGGTYVSFITGNLTNLKVPCAVNALQAAEVEAASEKGEVISTLATAISSITTTIIITAGVLLLYQIKPFLESPALAPAFANVMPALIGALGVVLISRDWKIAISPVIFMLVLFMAAPGLASAVGILVPVGVIVAVVAARILYKKNRL